MDQKITTCDVLFTCLLHILPHVLYTAITLTIDYLKDHLWLNMIMIIYALYFTSKVPLHVLSSYKAL